MSMALPVLLEAVRVYRISGTPSTVRDDFGVGLRKDGAPLKYPSGPDQPWAEELWFSDGGITSNFPIHLFDSILPLWPTVGVTLGSYPPGFHQQDVHLPQDWQGQRVVGSPVGDGIPGFVGKIVDAARGWRDTAQSQMPAPVGRIATVRQSSTEGGTNLFMPSASIASLALRGELAGARLRRRFRSEWWQRNQWLRFRASVSNLENLRERLAEANAVGLYADLAARGAAGLDDLIGALSAGDPDLPPVQRWYGPPPPYWPAASTLVEGIASIAPADVRGEGVPTPEPELRQVPPL
jgi:hypothetical protein